MTAKTCQPLSQGAAQGSVMCPEVFWKDRLHLGVAPPPFRHHGRWKFLNLVPPDALKMHSLAVPVLRFFCKTFSKLRKLNIETLFSVDVSKKSSKEKFKNLFWAPEFGPPNQYTRLPNSLDASL